MAKCNLILKIKEKLVIFLGLLVSTSIAQRLFFKYTGKNFTERNLKSTDFRPILNFFKWGVR